MATDRKLGLLGRKLGMTQVFGADGKRYGVTVVECGPCIVLGKKTKETDGYSAIQLSFGDIKDKHSTKAELGHAKKANTTAKKWVREFRVSAEVAGKYELGQTVSASELFTEGELLDLTAKTKGRGYTGVLKRWNFSGAPAAHGHHEFYRHGGSIGNREFPGRVFKNRKMAGQYGNERTTIQNMKLVKLVADKNLVLVHGAVPGGTNQLVLIRSAVKS